MYRFSRSIYREIASAVIEDERDPTGCRNKQLVLDACEETIRRLTYDRRYFARPARSLFNQVRMHFAIGDQLRVWMVIDRNIKLALEFLERMPEGAGLDGVSASAARTRARARRASASRCRGATTARRTSTSRRPSTGRSSRSRSSKARSSARRSRRGLSFSAWGWPPGGGQRMGTRPRLAKPGPLAFPDSVRTCCWESTSAGPSPTRCSTTGARCTPRRRRRRPTTSRAGVLAAVDAALERAGAAPARSRASPTG